MKTQAEANAVYQVPHPLITGNRLHDVALTDPGTIDGTDNGIRIKSMRGAGGLVEIVRYTDITLQDITLTAEKDFDIRDADHPSFERVTRTIQAGVAPPKIPGAH